MNKILRYSFIALLAMVFGNVMAEDVFVSDFSYATGEAFTGGGDGSFTGSVASKKIQSSNAEDVDLSSAYAQFITQWDNASLSNAYWGNQSIKLGTSSKDGSMTSIALGDKMTSSVKVTINVAGWGSGTNSMTVAASKGTIENPTVTITNGEFTDYSFTIADGDATTALTISGKRMFVKSVKVETTGSTPVITVKVPEFSIAGGLYFEPQTVSMSCEEGAKILYTIPAGQDPEYTNDNQYTGVFYDGNPLTISKTTTIKAMAVKDGKTSGIVTATYTIVNTTGKGTQESPFSVADALQVIGALENGKTTDNEYITKGIITEVTEISTKYGNATFNIADAAGGDVLTVFRAKDANGENITDENIVKVGDKVTIQGKLQRYFKDNVVTPEIAQGGKILSVESTTGINTISADKAKNGARYNLAGQKVNAGYKGVVIMNGQKVMQ